MTGIPLQVAEPTGGYRRSLRRYTYSTACIAACPGPGGGHDASTELGDVDGTDAERVHGDNWPHDDRGWPVVCASCAYEFTLVDQWQRNDNPVYRLPGGAEFTYRGSFGKTAPVGAMIRAPWYGTVSKHPDGIESWLVALPDGGEWITSQKSTSGSYWTVTGTPPLITVSPSIFHNSPAGWHGWIRLGMLEAA